MVARLVYQTLQWLLGQPIQTAGLSNLAMVAGPAYSNGWPIKPCNSCRAGLFKQGNGCWAGLSNLANVVGLAYSNKAMVAGLGPIQMAGLSNLAMAVGLAFSNKVMVAGLVYQTMQWLLVWSIKTGNNC